LALHPTKREATLLVTLAITDDQRTRAGRRLELIAVGRAAVANGADDLALLDELRALGASRDDATLVACRLLGWTSKQAHSAVARHPAWQVSAVPKLAHEPWNPSVVQATPGTNLVHLRRFNAIIFAAAVVCATFGLQMPALLIFVVLALLVLPFSSARLIAVEVRALRHGDDDNHAGGLILGTAILLVTGGIWLVVLWFLAELTS
jgi:hypothetical protein